MRIFLVLSLYLLQFLKLIGLQSRLRVIYKVMLILNAAVIFFCVKVCGMGMESIAVGMMTAAIFCLVSEGRQLYLRLGKNLFAPVKFSEIPIGKIFCAGSAVTLSKIFSLSQIVLYNFYMLHAFGLKGVAVFASLQIAIRICRTASAMTLQGITPILTVELGDKNLPAMILLFKTALRRGLIFAILPMIILLIGAPHFTESAETVEALRIYSLSLIPAAINAIMLTALLAVGHVKFSNLLAFLRSFALLIIFLAGAYMWRQNLVWWSFLFAELITLAVLIIGVKILKRKENLLPKMPPSKFFVIDHQENFDEQFSKDIQPNIAKILSEWVALNKKFSDRKKDNFHVVGVKAFLDGVIEAHTGWQIDDYLDTPGYHGLERFNDHDKMVELIVAADAEGLSVHVHSIGNGATKFMLDCIEDAEKITSDMDQRNILAHLQFVREEDIKRMAKTGSVPAVFTLWCPKEANIYDQEVRYVGEKIAEKGYPIKSFYDAGANVVFHSDYPVSPLFDIKNSFYVAEARDFPKGIGKVAQPRNMEEAITREQSLRAMTINVAHQWRQENRLGSIEFGKIANMTVFDCDFLHDDLEKVAKANVVATIIDGEEVYKA